MAEKLQPNQILQALEATYSELPGLVGQEQWIRIQPTLDAQLTELREARLEPALGRQSSMKIIEMLAQYPALRDRLRAELQMQEMLAKLELRIDEIGKRALAFFQLDEAGEEGTRRVVINADGIGGGSSRKAENVRLDVRRLIDALTDTAIGAVGALTTDHRIAIVTGVLGVIRSVNKAITIDIAEKDARIFHAMIEAGAHVAPVSEAALLDAANRRRLELGLAATSIEEMHSSLYALEQLKSIHRSSDVPVHWSIVESFRVRGS